MVTKPTKSKRKSKYCDKEYSDKRDLRRHIKKFHLPQTIVKQVKKIPSLKKIAKVNKREPFIANTKKWMTLD